MVLQLVEKNNMLKIQVPPSGIREAQIAIIGEAPGSDEVRYGKPFIGRAGRHFDPLLSNSGINRSSLYITNVLKVQPPGNDATTFIKYNSRSGIVTTTPTFNEYQKHLYKELKSVKANVLVAVGNIALYALTRKWQVTKWRGSVLKGITEVDGRKVIPIIHPAAALRNYEYNYRILADLRRIKDQSTFPEINLPKRKYIIKPSLDQSLGYLNLCSKQKLVSFDIEVTAGEVSCISFSYKDDEAISIPFLWGNKPYFTEHEETIVWNKIAKLLENPNILKNAQNATFDSEMLFIKYGIRVSECDDTMIQHAILYPDLPKGLDFLTSVQTLEPYYKDDGKFRKGQSRATDPEYALYNAKDSRVITEIRPKLMKYLDRQGNRESYERQKKLVPILVYMQSRGIRMNVEGLRIAKKKALEKRDLAKKALLEVTDGIVNNPASTAQLKKYFYGVLGIPPIRAKGSVTTDDPAMKKISLLGHAAADYVMLYRHNKTLSSQFFGVILSDDGRLRGAANPVGTVNLRLSSSTHIITGEGTNIQNQPHVMDQYMLADKGYLIYNVDIGQAESRIVAYIAPEPKMIETFEAGRDIHRLTASTIFNKPPEEIGDDDANPCSFGNGKRSERYWGKTSNHSCAYDFGPISYARKYGVVVKDAKFVIENYHSTYPGIRRMYKQVEEELRSNELTLENCYGHKRKFMGRWDKSLWRKGYNFNPQSTVAIKINEEGLIYIYYNQDKFKHVELLNQIHDSIIFQIPLSIPLSVHAEYLALIRDSLETPLHWRGVEFSLPIDVEVGFNLGNTEDIDVSNKTVSQISQSLKDAHERLGDAKTPN